MPVFLLIIFGFINFMMVMFGVCNITYAARAAARYGCMHSSTSMAPATTADFTNIINPLLYSYPSNTQSVSVTYSGGGANVVGSVISVAITVTYTIVLPGYTYNALPIRAKSTCLVVQ